MRWWPNHSGSEQSASLKTTMAAPKKVSVDAAIASIISELESISSLKEEQRTALKAFLNGKDVFVLLLRHIVMDGDRQMGHPITCQVCFVLCQNKPPGLSGYGYIAVQAFTHLIPWPSCLTTDSLERCTTLCI